MRMKSVVPLLFLSWSRSLLMMEIRNKALGLISDTSETGVGMMVSPRIAQFCPSGNSEE